MGQDIQKDLDFLREIRIHLKRWDEKSDYGSRDMAFTMVSDWIDELKKEVVHMTGEQPL